MNLYQFVDNQPVGRTDYLGLWSKNLHYGLTKRWSRDLGFSERAAEAIGLADDGVDHGATSFMPVIGDQRYHFNRNRNFTDSRLGLSRLHIREAKWSCLDSRGRPGSRPEDACQKLGTALHPLQDWVAHGDYGAFDDGEVYIPHNQYSPQRIDGAGGVTDYPDDITLDAVDGPDGRPAGRAMHRISKGRGMVVDSYAIYRPGRQRISLTYRLTKDALVDFWQFLEDSGSCACRSFFGVR